MSIIDNGRPSKPKRIRVGPPLDERLFAELTPEEQDALRAKAREKIAAERKKKAEDAFLAAAIEEERQATDPDVAKYPCFLDLPASMSYIMIDGVMYQHGQTHYVPQPVWNLLKEQEARGWAHEEMCGEPNRKYYRKPPSVGTANFISQVRESGTTMSMTTGAVTNAPADNSRVSGAVRA